MATSEPKKSSRSSSIKQEESAPKSDTKGKAMAGPSGQVKDYNGGLADTPLHTYSPDVSPEFRQYVDRFIADTPASLQARLARSAIGEQSSVPFASVREGERINVVVPLTMSRGDVLAELILLLMSKVPTSVVVPGTEGWQEPTWTAESSRHLMGIVSAVQGPPDSFASSSSPVDLARLAVWVSACNSALSQPGGVEGTVGSVLPTEVGGAKSASKYLARVFAALRTVSSDNMHSQAIKTLESLLKLWYKSVRAQALALVRRNKISWGTVLVAGSPTESKKVKGNLVTQIRSPSKPSRSPFLSGKERQAISSLLAPVWNTPEQLRVEWNSFSAQEQHARYGDFITALKLHYENVNKISTSIHAKLGHRKKWIHAACEEHGVVPSKKKDKSNEFIWTANFFKLDLTDVNISVALVFAPSHYLVDEKYDCDGILTRLFRTNRVIDGSVITDELCGVTAPLWKEWATRFEPDCSYSLGTVPPATTLEDTNPFAGLPEAEAS